QPPATPEHLDEPPQVVGKAGGLRVERLRQHLLGHDLDSSSNSLELGMTTDRQVSSARTSSSWGCANQVAIPKELSSSRPRLRLRGLRQPSRNPKSRFPNPVSGSSLTFKEPKSCYLALTCISDAVPRKELLWAQRVFSSDCKILKRIVKYACPSKP